VEIGYIGLGAMGGALARRLLDRHSLTVWDMNADAVKHLVALGASAAATAAEVGRKADIVFLCLPRSSDVRGALFGPEGLARTLAPGKLVIDQTTGVPSETRVFAQELAAREIGLLDAPVAGGVPNALAGTVTIMASGPRRHYDHALPVLKDMSPKVFFCGERVGSGQASKLINNSINSGYRIATLEIAALAAKLGLSLRATNDVLTNGWANNFTAFRLFSSLLRDQPSTDFALALMLKDVNQAIALGLDNRAPMPIAGIVRGVMQIGLNGADPRASLDIIVEVVETMAGARLKAPSVESADPARPFALRDIGVVLAGLPTEALPAGFAALRRLDAEEMERPDLPPIVVDFTRRSYEDHRRLTADLARRGVARLDATTANAPGAHADATTAHFVGGSDVAFASLRAAFESSDCKAIHCGAAGTGEVARLVANAVAACNRAVVYENAAVGLKAGLDPEAMALVLNEGSGWSAEGKSILAALTSDAATTTAPLGAVADDLRALLHLAIAHGAPLLIAAEVLAQHAAEEALSGPNATLDALKRRYEAAAGIRFADYAQNG